MLACPAELATVLPMHALNPKPSRSFAGGGRRREQHNDQGDRVLHHVWSGVPRAEQPGDRHHPADHCACAPEHRFCVHAVQQCGRLLQRHPQRRVRTPDLLQIAAALQMAARPALAMICACGSAMRNIINQQFPRTLLIVGPVVLQVPVPYWHSHGAVHLHRL